MHHVQEGHEHAFWGTLLIYTGATILALLYFLGFGYLQYQPYIQKFFGIGAIGFFITGTASLILFLLISGREKRQREMITQGTGKMMPCPHCGKKCAMKIGEGFWCDHCSIYF
jgi:hypothetical protein